MLGIRLINLVSPSKDCDGELSDSSVDGGSILGVPDNESVVFSKSSEESIIRTEGQLLNAHLHTLKNSNWLLSVEVPENNRCIRQLLENSSELPCSQDVSRFRNCYSRNLHVVASKELLIMFVVDILEHEKTSDIVDHSVVEMGMEVHGILVLAVVADGVFKL
jgi:hypothetical protein